MDLTPEKIVENWESLLKIIEDNFTGERKTNLLKLYKHFEDRILYCPASGKDFYHGAYPGGYVEHVLNVVYFAMVLDNIWVKEGFVKNYSDESLIFAALNHDLGKIGDEENEYFISHNEKWRKERGEIYIHNDKIRFMEVQDRSLWLLQDFGIKVSQSEMLAIKLHDGMYSEGNKPYLVAYTEGKQLKDNLPVILHHADMMATMIEKSKWSSSKPDPTSPKVTKELKKIKNEKMSEITKQFFNLE